MASPATTPALGRAPCSSGELRVTEGPLLRTSGSESWLHASTSSYTSAANTPPSTVKSSACSLKRGSHSHLLLETGGKCHNQVSSPSINPIGGRANIHVETTIYVIYSYKVKSGFNINLVLLMTYSHWYGNSVLKSYLYYTLLVLLDFYVYFTRVPTWRCAVRLVFPFLDQKLSDGRAHFVFIFHKPSWHRTKAVTEWEHIDISRWDH